MSNRPTLAMTAIVIATYLCALVVAREAPQSDKSLLTRPAFRAAATKPSTATIRPAMASIDISGR